MKEAEARGDHMLEQCFPEGLQSVEGSHAGSAEKCDGLFWIYHNPPFPIFSKISSPEGLLSIVTGCSSC